MENVLHTLNEEFGVPVWLGHPASSKAIKIIFKSQKITIFLKYRDESQITRTMSASPLAEEAVLFECEVCARLLATQICPICDIAICDLCYARGTRCMCHRQELGGDPAVHSQRYGNLTARTDATAIPLWEGKYFSQVLPFIIPYMVPGPDYHPERRW